MPTKTLCKYEKNSISQLSFCVQVSFFVFNDDSKKEKDEMNQETFIELHRDEVQS